jgi:pyrroloquinoline quinone biosynthesis protein B
VPALRPVLSWPAAWAAAAEAARCATPVAACRRRADLVLRVLVLGAAAGGGLPQWNCACACCTAARHGTHGVTPQTQSSIAVTADGESFLLVNASPDLRTQVAAHPALHPRPARREPSDCAAARRSARPGSAPLRHSPIGAVLLTNADVDHVAGLLTLREKEPFTLLATSRVQDALRQSRIFDVLDPAYVTRRALALDVVETLDPGRCRGEASGARACGEIEVRLFSVPGKVALYLEDASQGPGLGTVVEDTVAVELRDPRSRARCFYVPGCASLTVELCDRLRGASVVLFDGTVWSDDEMIAQGAGLKTGARMGHMAMAGSRGSLEGFASLGVGRKLYVHINNTNPVWLADSPERAAVARAGWEIAHDGMVIEC